MFSPRWQSLLLHTQRLVIVFRVSNLSSLKSSFQEQVLGVARFLSAHTSAVDCSLDKDYSGSYGVFRFVFNILRPVALYLFILGIC